MITQTKNLTPRGANIASALWLAFFAFTAPLSLFAAPPAANSGSSIMPGSGPASGTTAPIAKPSMGQADAFETAGEQAAFLGVYQMSFGPYGMAGDQTQRDALLKATAAAIDDCLKNINCDDKKKDLILKALVQYNMNQDIKRAMLENNTKRENMRSLSDPNEVGYGKPLSGKTFTYATEKDGKKLIRPLKSGGEAEALSTQAGSDKLPYYQLEEGTVKGEIDEKYLQEREIMGDAFLKDYAAFIDNVSVTRDEDARRFAAYKKIEAREGYIFNPEADDKEQKRRLAEIQGDQNNKNVRDAVESYKKSLKVMTGRKNDDGKVELTGGENGLNLKKVGFGETVNTDLSQYADVSNLQQNGEFVGNGKYQAITRAVNQTFKKTAEDRLAADAKARAPASGASASAAGPNAPIALVLDPTKFDQFLDEIWPSSKKREQMRK